MLRLRVGGFRSPASPTAFRYRGGVVQGKSRIRPVVQRTNAEPETKRVGDSTGVGARARGCEAFHAGNQERIGALLIGAVPEPQSAGV